MSVWRLFLRASVFFVAENFGNYNQFRGGINKWPAHKCQREIQIFYDFEFVVCARTCKREGGCPGSDFVQSVSIFDSKKCCFWTPKSVGILGVFSGDFCVCFYWDIKRVSVCFGCPEMACLRGQKFAIFVSLFGSEKLTYFGQKWSMEKGRIYTGCWAQKCYDSRWRFEREIDQFLRLENAQIPIIQSLKV